MTHRFFAQSVAGLMGALTLVLVGCSSTGTSAATPSAAYRVGSTTGYGTYETLSENRTFVQSAIDELTRRCMARGGYKFWPPQPTAAKYRDPGLPLTVADATQRGYQALDPPNDHALGALQDKYFGAMSDAQSHAYQSYLSGDPNKAKQFVTYLGSGSFAGGGCAYSSVSQIVNEPADYVRLALIMSNLTVAPEYHPGVDPVLTAPLISWKSCMSRSGYSIKTPGAARQRGAELNVEAARQGISPDQTAVIPDTPSPESRNLAIADAKCRTTNGWNVAFSKAAHNALAVVIDAHEADVLKFNELSSAAVSKAKTVLG